jgi:predicted dehydrogenase
VKKKTKLGIGFVGGGFITRFHIRSWIGVRDADVLGIVDPDPKRAREAAALARSLGVGAARVFKSVTAMAADPAIDAIWICSPNYTRLEVMDEIALAVIKGKGELVGVSCEKPLGRNVGEAKAMLTLVRKARLLDGYLENQVFSPAVVRGRDIVWARGASLCGPPYLARAAEEHSGPHMPWFWEGTLQGGGVLNDMMCHSVEEARYMLTAPGPGVAQAGQGHGLRVVPQVAGPEVRQDPGRPERREDRLPQAAGRGLRPVPHRVQG